MNSDFKELLQCLNDRKAHYLIIGGYTVSYYSEPRYTKKRPQDLIDLKKLQRL